MHVCAPLHQVDICSMIKMNLKSSVINTVALARQAGEVLMRIITMCCSQGGLRRGQFLAGGLQHVPLLPGLRHVHQEVLHQARVAGAVQSASSDGQHTVHSLLHKMDLC